ncbi:MAG: helix-turn-helix domain-containing protein [Nanoarchaeota archaeon]|nr:helix-turn-helix domain-containing protein [Nanoarchaeota archaeon]
MNILSVFNKSIKLPFIIFLVLLIFSLILGLELRSSTLHYIETFEPISEALEHKRVDLYSDAILVYRYYATQNFSDLIKIEEEIKNSDTTCTRMDTTLANYYSENIISTPQYESYISSVIAHSNAETIKDELLKQHRQSLVNNNNQVNQSLFLEYEELIFLAIQDIEKEILRIQIEKEEAQATLRMTELTTGIVIISILIVFIIFSIRHIIFVRKKIIDPIKSINTKTNSIFGNEETENIDDLESKVQSIISFIEKETITNPQKKKEFKEHILKSEYHEIISFLKLREEHQKATTMKDIKIHLKMTHPTLMARLKYLEEHSYIEITKNGRDKIISLL